VHGARVTGQGRFTCTSALRCAPRDRTAATPGARDFSCFGRMLNSSPFARRWPGWPPSQTGQPRPAAGRRRLRPCRSPTLRRVLPSTSTGNPLRRVARIMSAFAYMTGDRSMAPIMRIAKLAALAEAVAELRQSQRHAIQAAACPALALPCPAPRASTAAQLAGLSFLAPARPVPRPSPPDSSALRPSPPRPPGSSR
jgi:hypothetical protein